MAKRKKQIIKIDRVFIIAGLVAIIMAMIILIVKKEEKQVEMDKRAVWISYLNMETLKDKEEAAFRDAFSTICNNAKNNKLNTLIVHVRPFMDAMYPSERFMPSTYLTSKNSYTYDPLAIMIDIAHQEGLSFEAWINPYRIANGDAQLEHFKQYSPIASWLNTQHILSDGSQTILNPASKKARDYIIAGVKEIIDYYDVDGIHFDDYFYLPNVMQNTTMEERKANVNLLVKEVYQVVKSKNSSLTFGISPQGNLENARNIGADIDTWLSQEGYVDYVMPQIYWTNSWGMDGSVNMFSTRVQAYNEIHHNDEIKLYAGLALYLCNQKVNGDLGWQESQDNLKRQVEELSENNWYGYALFDYDSMLDPITSKEREQLLNIIK